MSARRVLQFPHFSLSLLLPLSVLLLSLGERFTLHLTGFSSTHISFSHKLKIVSLTAQIQIHTCTHTHTFTHTRTHTPTHNQVIQTQTLMYSITCVCVRFASLCCKLCSLACSTLFYSFKNTPIHPPKHTPTHTCLHFRMVKPHFYSKFASSHMHALTH